MAKKRSGSVMYQPNLGRGMMRGINQFVNALRPTFGPLGRTVIVASTASQPILLDNGNDIAKRITELSGDAENAGAMLTKELMQRQQDATSDGSVTTALLFQKICELGFKYIASGGDAQLLRQNLNKRLPIFMAELERLRYSVQGKNQLVALAKSQCQDQELATELGEIFDVIGPFGRLDIRTHYQTKLHTEYVDGSYWPSEPFSKDMLWHHRTSATLVEPAIFLSDLDFDQTDDLIPIFKAASQRAYSSLLIVARSFSAKATNAMYALMQTSKIRCVAVKLPGLDATEQMATLEDLSILTQAQAFHKAAGLSSKSLKPEQLGQVRRARVKINHVLFTGFSGDISLKKQQLHKLKRQYANNNDAKTRNALQKRISKLTGGSATLWLPDQTKSETKIRKNMAERLASFLRHVLLAGVVPGGGSALFACSCVLKKECPSNPDERAADQILIIALEEPARALLDNANCDPARALISLSKSQQGYGYDITKSKSIKMTDEGILDSFEGQMMAIQNAVKTAALALTVEAFVH